MPETSRGHPHDTSRCRFRSLVPADLRRDALPRHVDGARSVDLAYVKQIAIAADALGYYGVLILTGSGCEDAWVVASALAP